MLNDSKGTHRRIADSPYKPVGELATPATVSSNEEPRRPGKRTVMLEGIKWAISMAMPGPDQSIAHQIPISMKAGPKGALGSVAAARTQSMARTAI